MSQSSSRPFLLPLLAACVNEAGIDRRVVPPVVSILTPTDGELFRQGDEGVSLSGTVSDTRDLPEDLVVRWYIDLGEEVATEVAATVDSEGNVTGFYSSADLAVGPHTLTLSAVDTDDAEAVVTVPFNVGGPFGPPEVTIFSPEDFASFDPGESVTFQGEASDETTPVGDLVFAIVYVDSELEERSLGRPVDCGGVGASIGGLVTRSRTATANRSDSITVTVAELVTKAAWTIFSELMVNPLSMTRRASGWSSTTRPGLQSRSPATTSRTLMSTVGSLRER